MKKKILLIILIFLSLFYISYLKINVKDNKYIILNNKNIWQIKNDKILKVNSNIINTLNYKKSKLYINNEIIKGYMKLDSNELYFYDQSFYKRSFLSNSIITINKEENYKLFLSEMNLSESDKTIINNYFKEKSENFDIDQLFLKKITINENHKIYSVSTLEESEENYTYIFAYYNNEFIDIYNNFTNNRSSNIHFAIDINNDDNYDLVLFSDIPGSAGNECFSLYIFDGSQYKAIINCEEGD